MDSNELDEAIKGVEEAISLNKAQLDRLYELHHCLIEQLHENAQLYEAASNEERDDEEHVTQASDIPGLNIFSYPYFKDERGFSAPENEDTLKLRRIGHRGSIESRARKKIWTKVTCKQLQDLVLSEFRGRSVADLTESRNSLASRLEILQSVIDQESSQEDLNRNEQIKEKITELTALIEERLADVTIPSREDSEHLDWLRIAANMTSFSDVDCKLKWMNELHPDIDKEPFSPKEIETIRELVNEGNKNWSEIAEKLSQPGKLRLAWQVCKYYQSNFNEDTKRVGPLSEEERELLELLVSENTDKNTGEIDWQRIKYHINGRTISQLKLYWTKKNSLKKGLEWSQFEDRVLTAAVEKFGESSWNQVAHYVFGRTNRQCRERWTNRTSISDRKGGNWTREEDEKLIMLAPEFDLKWAKMQKEFPGRNERQLSARFALISRWVQNGQEAKLTGDDSERATVAIPIKSKSHAEIKSKWGDRLSSENALMQYLEESREKLRVQFEKNHRVPVVDVESEEHVENQLLEFFSYHNAHDSSKTQIALSANDTLMYDTLAYQLAMLIDGEQIEPLNPLQEVTQSAILRDVSCQVSRQLSDDSQEKASLFILPPNLVTLRGMQGLHLQQSRLEKIVTDSGVDLEEAMSKYSLSDPHYRQLFTRFLSLFYWPLICSLENAPCPPMSKEPSDVPRTFSKESKSMQAAEIVKIRDRQNWLFKSAVGQGNKLTEIYRAIAAAKAAGTEATLTSEQLDEAFNDPSTSKCKEPASKPVKENVKKDRKRKAAPQPVPVPQSSEDSRKSRRERRPPSTFDL